MIQLQRLREGHSLYDLFDNDSAAKNYINSLPYPSLVNKVGIELEFISPLSRAELVAFLLDNGVSVRAVNRGDTDYTYWGLKNDASIRVEFKDQAHIIKQFNSKNIPPPRLYSHELTSPIITNDEELKAIGKICKLLSSSYNNNINFPVAIVNPTCGLHIHVSIERLTLMHRESIYNLFKTVEPELGCLLPPSRVANGTCKPVKGLPLETRETLDKYYSIYHRPHLGTYEYRKFYATKNWWTIRCLILLLDALHCYGKANIIPYDYQCSLYDLTESTILHHFISTQKKKVLEERDNLLTDIPASVEVIRRTHIPVLL